MITAKYINVPKELRGKLEDCHYGGTLGIFVTTKQLTDFAKIIKNEYIDEVIPLNIEWQVDPKHCDLKHSDPNTMANAVVYWETEIRKHGWCCTKCGEVIQWG